MSRYRPPVKSAFSGELWIESIGTQLVVGRDYAIDAATMLARRNVPLACDIESEGLNELGRRLKCVIFSPYPDGETSVILDPRDPHQWQAIADLIDRCPWLFFYNSCYDVPNLGMNRLMRPVHAAKIEDPLLTARLAEPDSSVRKSLADVANRYLGYGFDKEGMLASAKAVGMTSKQQMYREFDLDRMVYLRGAATDAAVTARVRDPLRAAAYTRLTDHPFGNWGVGSTEEAVALINREQRLNRMALARTLKGYRVDLDFSDAYNARFATKLAQQEEELTTYGIRAGNANDLTAWLDRQGAIPPGYPRTGKTKALSGKKEDLAKLNHPVARTFVFQKEHTKTYRDYLSKVRDLAHDDGSGVLRLYPTINFLKAVTGRMSIGDPPLQQFPEAARGIILFDGEGTSIDWSQIEPTLIAYIAGDENVIGPYERGDGKIYDIVARFANVSVKQAKTQTLGTLYGQGLDLTASKLGVDVPMAQQIKAQVFGAMPAVYEFTQDLRNIARQFKLVPTLSGRIIPIPEQFFEGRKSVATHKGVNYFVQGSAYDVLAEALVGCIDEGYAEALYFAMHDETLSDTEASRDIQRIMARPPLRLVERAGRTPLLKTDLLDLGERWNVA